MNHLSKQFPSSETQHVVRRSRFWKGEAKIIIAISFSVFLSAHSIHPCLLQFSEIQVDDSVVKKESKSTQGEVFIEHL
jgi:hypothetical protein